MFSNHLGNRDRDSLLRRDVSGGREGALVSPGVGHNLYVERRGVNHCRCTVTKVFNRRLTPKGYSDVG